MKDIHELEDWLRHVIYEGNEEIFEGNYEVDISTFEEEGIISGNKGLCLKFENGNEFQITIVQSK